MLSPSALVVCGRRLEAGGSVAPLRLRSDHSLSSGARRAALCRGDRRTWRRIMSHHFKSRATIALGCVLALAAGFFLGPPGSGDRDMLDAVAAVQRRSPRFLVSEPVPPANWARGGALYLCRRPRAAHEVDGLGKHPWHPDPRWAGVVCFKGTTDPNQRYDPWVADGGDGRLHYGTFAV